MKKFLALLLALMMIIGMVGCASGTTDNNGGNENQGDSDNSGDDNQGDTTDNGEIKVALFVSATGELDDNAFHSAAYAGIRNYCDAHDIPYTYYKPSENTVEMQMAVCDTAVEAGAEFIVVCSDQYKVALLEMSETYPDVMFLGFEANPQNTDGEITVHDNVKVVNFAAEQSGFMAGYASVVEGYKNLGIMGGKMVPGVLQYCYGFVAGADYAASELGYDDVTVRYTHWGENSATPEHQAQAASWYQTGTEVIFSVAGPGNSSVFAAAEQNDGVAIGCDSDQSVLSDTVITSALKDLTSVCEDTLEDWDNGKFTGGETYRLGAESNATGLAMESSKFERFTQEDYDTLYEKIATNEDGIADSIPNDTNCSSATDIEVNAINYEYIA